MNYLYPAKILALCCPFLASSHVGANEQLLKDESVVYAGKEMKIIVPECPLSPGSLQIAPLTTDEKFSQWPANSKVETFELLQKIIKIWEQKGITNYLIYGKESNSSIFNWEIVPYPKDGSRIWKQFKVLWNITLGDSCLPQVERNKLAKDFQNDMESFSNAQAAQIKSIESVAKGNDAFCNPAVIAKQVVFEGKYVNVLYNYAPIVLGEDKLHFLVIPKEHREKFSDLTQNEYLEAMQLSQKLVDHYHIKGYLTAYLFDKTGAEAGQTVPHWHEHVVFTATKTQDFVGKLMVLKNMLLYSSPLPAEELKTRVQALKEELQDVLSTRRGH